MQKNYRKSDIGTPKNTYEIQKKSLGLSSQLLQFQKMVYTLQLGEKTLKFPNPEITLWVDDVEKYQLVQDHFETLIEYLLDEYVIINFKKGTKIQSQSIQPIVPYEYDYLSLFSGGLDSIAIPFLTNYSGKNGILHHTITHPIPQGKAIVIFNKYFKSTKKQTLVTSTNKNKVEDPAYLKTRGLIFLTNALCVASELNIPEVIIPENGPFMINFPVSASTDPTRTTDPFMMETLTKIFNHVTDSNIIITTPFKDMTKSEVILSSGNDSLIQDTWSCSYFQGKSNMCGMCNSCLVRILSCYAIDEGENLEQFYEINPFDVDPSVLGNRNQRNYSISEDTATFCRSILNPNTLNDIEKEKFSNLQKMYPILCNYALDLMLGFQNLSVRYRSTQPIFTHFKKMLDYIDPNLLETRRLQLMQQKSDFGWM